MQLRKLTALAASVSLALLLNGCGNPSSDQANQDDQAETAATPQPAPQDDTEQVADAQDQSGAPAEDGNEGREAEQDNARSQPAQPARSRPASAPVPRHVATPQIGAGVQGDGGMFYDALDRDGAWVRHPEYNYVWIPGRVGPGWRPYQEGNWIWTDAYGWYWESDEPFGWAVYHYGRWDYDPDYGWFWVPGDTWSPAWVTWRFGGNSVGWAPVAPDRPGFAAGVPRRYAPPVAEGWVFVDAADFTDQDLDAHILPMSRIGPSLEIATEIRNPRFANGRMVNFGAPRDEMQRHVKGPIRSRQLVYVGDERDAFDDVSGRRTGIYRPMIAGGDIRRAPRRLGDVGQTERVIIRDYAGPGPGREYDAPSAALLDVLDIQERQSLVEARLNAKREAVDARIDQLQAERAALIEERRKQAKKLEAKLDKERREAREDRREGRQKLREDKQQRAAEIRVDTTAPSAGGASGGPAPKPQAPAAAGNAIAPGEPLPATPKTETAPAPISVEKEPPRQPAPLPVPQEAKGDAAPEAPADRKKPASKPVSNEGEAAKKPAPETEAAVEPVPEATQPVAEPAMKPEPAPSEAKVAPAPSTPAPDATPAPPAPAAAAAPAEKRSRPRPDGGPSPDMPRGERAARKDQGGELKQTPQVPQPMPPIDAAEPPAAEAAPGAPQAEAQGSMERAPESVAPMAAPPVRPASAPAKKPDRDGQAPAPEAAMEVPPPAAPAAPLPTEASPPPAEAVPADQ